LSTLPKFNLNDVDRRRTRLVNQVFSVYVGERIDGGALTELVTSVRRAMPSYATRDNLFESLRHLTGTVLTEALAVQTAWRLAGNLPRFKQGHAVPPWASQADKEWVPLQIMRIIPARNQHNKYGYNVSFVILAGTPCPRVIVAFWNRQMIKLVARLAGFSFRSSSRYRFYKPTELVGLRILGELEPEKSKFTPTFWAVDAPGSFIKWNRDNVLKQRKRIIPCPRNYIGACHKCAVGYLNCAGGTHKLDYCQKFCTECVKEAQWFDPEYGMDRCINCNIKRHTRKIS